ncbi:MAG TPA: ribosome small subunit-dependent GTPase A, partial [Solirubrobacterales bacterium]|nr:ribosome small subunit-dependent GTPase A [Solirubrobacterales bacterium]
AGLGRRDGLAAELAAGEVDDLTPARVLAQHRGLWLIASPGGASRLAPARGRLRGETPVTGDWVGIDPSGAIACVLERRGALVRRIADSATESQVLAANVDVALIAEPLPAPNPQRIERLTALAAEGGVRAVLLLTKADLDPEAHLVAGRLARQLGLAEGLAISATEGEGLPAVLQVLEAGSTAALLGPSGAGKSTLVNALLGAERQATSPVRASDGKGRHTTVTRELIPLPNGALLIDMPGLRNVALWTGGEEAFAEIEELASRCRFSDCQHESEPGCAVREEVDPERLRAWRKLQREEAWVQDRQAASRERERVGRDSARQVREGRAAKGDVDR